jgi:hypothetical protein
MVLLIVISSEMSDPSVMTNPGFCGPVMDAAKGIVALVAPVAIVAL